MKKSFITPLRILVVLIVFHLVGNLAWLSLNNLPPGWDEAAHTKGAIEFGYFFSQILHGNFNSDLFFIPFNDPYGPLVKMFGGLLITFLYPDVKLLQFVGTIFFLGTMGVLYVLGKELYRNDWISLLGVSIFSFFLFIYDRSRLLSLDVPLLFFLLLSTYLLIRSSHFTKPFFTIGYFITLAFAYLTKVQAPIYFIPPLLFTLWKGRHEMNRTTMVYIFTGVLIAVFLIIPWLFISYKGILQYFEIASTLQINAPSGGLLQLSTWLYYIDELVNSFLTPVCFVAYTFVLYLSRRTKYSYDKPLLSYIVFIYFVFTIFPNKNLRYIFPALPFLSLIYAKSLYVLHERYQTIGRIVILLLFIFNVFLYINLSFAWPLEREVFANIPYTTVRRYDPSITPLENMATSIKEFFAGKPGEIVFIPNPEYFSINTFNMSLRLYNINNVSAVQPAFTSFNPTKDEVSKVLAQYDYFYFTEGDLGLPWLVAAEGNTMQKQVQEYVITLLKEEKAEKVFEYVLPNLKQDKVWFVRRK